jgi:hypothetical protein
MAKVVVIGPNLPRTSEAHHAHAPACAHLGNSIYASREYDDDKKRVYDFATFKELTHEIYGPSEFNYDGDTQWRDFAQDIKVFPCVKGMPDE